MHISTKPLVGGFAVSQLQYLHKDALGSIDLITDAQGGMVERLSFDPFGMRRSAQWQAPDYAFRSELQTLGYSLTTRGFTGHEHLDDFDLIHMNGRVYDPVIGRFLSADPFVQAPFNSQSYNRYSYVWNNPLSAVDPSGYEVVITITDGVAWQENYALPVFNDRPIHFNDQPISFIDNHANFQQHFDNVNASRINVEFTAPQPTFSGGSSSFVSSGGSVNTVAAQKRNLNPFNIIATEGAKWWKSEVSDPFNEHIYNFRNFEWRGGIVGFTFGFSYTTSFGFASGWSMSQVAGTDGRTLGTNNIDLGAGTPGFEIFIRGLIGVNNTIDDLKGAALTVTAASGKRSASASVPLNTSQGRVDTRASILEGGFTTSNGGAAATWSYGIGANEDRWY